MSGCNEYESMSRRMALSTLAGMVPTWVPSVKFAEPQSSQSRVTVARDVIVTIYLRGGMDGLTTCVPYGDKNYYALRPHIAVPAPDSANTARRAYDLDGFFGVPQVMKPILDLYSAGVLAFIHGSGSTDPTRSHFDAQHFMEAGTANPNLWTGWLGRHLASVSPSNPAATLRAFALGNTMPLTLQGSPKALALTSLNNVALGGNSNTVAKRTQWLANAYAGSEAIMADTANSTLTTMAMLKAINISGYKPGGGATFTDTHGGNGNGFLDAMKSASALIKKQTGVEAVHIDMGGWDTHVNEDPFSPWAGMCQNLDFLSRGLADLYADLNSANLMGNVTVVVMSEFGRAAAENGSYGTDHGHGNCMIVMGNNINGKKVYRNQFSLDSGQLSQGRDLAVTTDYRLVLAEIVAKRLQNSNMSAVFPTYSPTPFLGICK